MKHQVLAVVVGSLFALPAFAMDRDVPFVDADFTPSVSAPAGQPRGAAQRTGETFSALELGRSIN